MRASILLLGVVCTAFAATTEIKVDQVGYLPNAPKIAMVVHLNGQVDRFTIRRAGDDSVAFEGILGPPVLIAIPAITCRAPILQS